jgi:tetratricopeptide (TPR) repeat protein
MKEDDVLSDAARLAINRHLRVVLIPTGIAASAVAFLLGFFVNEVARSTAYTGALQGFADQIQTISADVGRAKGEAETAKRDADKAKGEVELILTQTRVSKLELEQLQGQVRGKVQEVGQILAQTRASMSELEQLRAEVEGKVQEVAAVADSFQNKLKLLEADIANQLKEVRSDVSGIEERVDQKLTIVAVLSQQGYDYKNKAAVALREGKDDEANDLLNKAEKSFQRILDINPKDPGALNGLGSVYFYRGDLDRAEAYVRKALEILPEYEEAQHDLQVILRMKKQRQPD